MTTPQQQPPPPGYGQQPPPVPPGQQMPGYAPQPPPGPQPPLGQAQPMGAPPGAPSYPSQQAPQGLQQPPLGQTPPQPVGPQVVQTDAAAADGIAKCPRCGASQIRLNLETGNLRCGFCRHEPESKNALETYGLDGPPRDLTGKVVGSGSADIIPSTAEVLTFKCSACGAEVVIDTNSSTQARCHWCRNTLSMNQQIPNGAVPDMILPFKITKEDAVARIEKFVGKRVNFSHPKFKAEFNAENVLGVYLPYMVVDVNAKVALAGQGEHQTRSYTVGSDDNKRTVYDADLYDVQRDFDLYVDDLTVESSSEYLDQNAFKNSNNVINTIMPFDVENSVVYDSNYLAGFTSERRDTNVEALAPMVTQQAQDVARHHANDTLEFYDRGARWDNEQIDIRGERWVSAYLPVWLYSYYEQKNNGQTFTHYVAVNGRTGETMGSVPIHQGKLLAASAIVEAIAIVLMIILMVVL